jgi:2-polyprenyl-6-methoxyphenol hydroxylase-like FAD-dependent oxidoreductase
VKDAIPKTHAERIAEMKRRAEGYAEPLKSIVMDIPDDLPLTTPLRLADFPCVPWDNRDGRITLAGDACHAMTM